MRHLKCVTNFGYHVPAEERTFWRKKVLKVKILESGHAKLAVRALFEKQHWKIQALTSNKLLHENFIYISTHRQQSFEVFNFPYFLHDF